jgi:hypothetical protein
MAPVKVHASKLSGFVVSGLDPEHADDLATGVDHPERVAPGFRKYLAEPAYLSVDGRLNVLIETITHLRRSKLLIDTDEKVDNPGVVGIPVRADDGRCFGCRHQGVAARFFP